MIPTKCAHFISRNFLDMMHGTLNCQIVATLLIIAKKSLLFDKFREVSSFYINSMFFLRKCVTFIWKFSMRAWKREWKNMPKNHAKCVKRDRSASVDKNILKLDVYSLIRADRPGNLKRGGVCLYYKENLFLKYIKTKHFSQCLLCRISIQNQTCGYL